MVMREPRSMHILTAAIELYTYRNGIELISKGGTGVLRVKILLQDLVTSEIPVYERFFLQRIVKRSIQRASQHFSQKLLIFSVGKCVAFSYRQSLQQQFTSHLSYSSKSSSNQSPLEYRQHQRTLDEDRAVGIFLSVRSIAIGEPTGKSFLCALL